MGPKFSEGAIVQHLSKLREKCAKAGVPVPPGLRRGGGNIQGTLNTNENQAGTNNAGKPAKRKRKAAKQAEDSDESEDQQDIDSTSDGQYGNRKAKGKGTKIAKGSGSSRVGRKATASRSEKHEGEDSNLSDEENSSQGSLAPSEECFAAGDRMWDLDSGEDTGSEPASSNAQRSILKLKIGVTGFEKLGLGKRNKNAAKGEGEKGESVKHESEASQGTSTDILVPWTQTDTSVADVAVPDYDGSEYEDYDEEDGEDVSENPHGSNRSQSSAPGDTDYDRVNAFFQAERAKHDAAYDSPVAALNQHRNAVTHGLSNGFNPHGYVASTSHYAGGYDGFAPINSGYGLYLDSANNAGGAANPGTSSMGYANGFNSNGLQRRPSSSTQHRVSNAGFNAYVENGV